MLSIAGNVDVDEVIEIADRFLKPCEDISLEIEFPDEPETINIPEVVQKLPVGTPLFGIGFKTKPVSGSKAIKTEMEASILLSLIAGSTSILYKQLFDEGLINSSFSSEVFSGDGYFANIFSGESKNPREVLSRLVAEIERVKTNGLDREQYEIIKKSKYGQLVRSFNNVEACASLMLNSHFVGVNAFENVEVLANITFEDVQNRLYDLFNTENVSISIVERNNFV